MQVSHDILPSQFQISHSRMKIFERHEDKLGYSDIMCELLEINALEESTR